MKIFTLLLLFLTLSIADEYKKIAVIPANINYNKESAQEFAEMLYDSVLNSIAEFNFTQKVSSDMYQLRGPLLAQKKYHIKIRNAHVASESDPLVFMQKHKLDKLLVMDFNTKRIIYTMSRCKKLCNVKISFKEYTLGKKPVSKKITYKYDANSCLLSDSSTLSMNKSIASFLHK